MTNIFENAIIVDVRSSLEFAQGHYPGAVNIPLDQVQARLQEFRQMNGPVVAYCRSGNRSGMAVAILKQSGIKEIYNGGALEDLMHQKNETNVPFN